MLISASKEPANIAIILAEEHGDENENKRLFRTANKFKRIANNGTSAYSTDKTKMFLLNLFGQIIPKNPILF